MHVNNKKMSHNPQAKPDTLSDLQALKMSKGVIQKHAQIHLAHVHIL